MKLMPGSVPAPKNVNPSLQMFTSLMSICWSQVKRDTAEAHDATTTAAMLKWRPEEVKVAKGLACPLPDTNFSRVAF